MTIKIRQHKAGDIGWIISKHGEIYTQEFGFDTSFELHIAKKFVDILSSKCDKFNTIWIAEVNGQKVGSIAVWKKTPEKAFINFVLVDHTFRGHGISKQLLNKVIHHSRQKKFNSIELETYGCLTNARKLYKKYGFTIFHTDKKLSLFGVKTDREFWELVL